MAVPLRNARLDARDIAVAANGRDRPAAIVCNAHITGLAVARSLARRGVPVIGLDREPHGVALASNALVAAAVCHDPIAQEEAFVADVLAIGEHLDRPAVLFGCMDEWVLALSAGREALGGAFAKNPYLCLFVASGWYDLATPYFATRHTLGHLALDPETRGNIRTEDYPVGHMVYLEKGSLAKLKADVAAFLRDATGGEGKPLRG